tara:strand:- start:243 stop:446 length:204 start_codon:yes stop_codon:yes gene_type:complete
MFSSGDFLIIWCSVAIPWWAGALYLGRKLDDMSKVLDRMCDSLGNMKQLTACGKPVKVKKVIRGNDK